MKYIAILSAITSITTAAVISIPVAEHGVASPIKLKENQAINIKASADLSPEKLARGASNIVIEITANNNNSPNRMEMNSHAGVAKMDVVEETFDDDEDEKEEVQEEEDKPEDELISSSQLNPDGQNAVSRSLLEKLINFLFGDNDGLIADGFNFTIGIGGKKRRPRAGEIEQQKPSNSRNNNKEGEDEDESKSPGARSRSRRSRPNQGANDAVYSAPPAPPPSSPPPTSDSASPLDDIKDDGDDDNDDKDDDDGLEPPGSQDNDDNDGNGLELPEP